MSYLKRKFQDGSYVCYAQGTMLWQEPPHPSMFLARACFKNNFTQYAEVQVIEQISAISRFILVSGYLSAGAVLHLALTGINSP